MSEPPDRDEPPPILGSWSRLYLVVLVELALVIVFLGWLTWRYS